MDTFEIIITFFGSSIFIALIAMFYRMGYFQAKIETAFKRIDEHFDQRFLEMEKRFDQRFLEMEKRFDQRFEAIDRRFDRMENDIKDIRKDTSSIDKEVGIITATLKFNGFDLDRHKAEGE